MTWNELKQFCNSLDEKQLKKEVILFREEEVIKNINTDTFNKDHYYFTEYPEEGCFPKSEIKDLSNCKKVYNKTQPILWEKF